MGFEQAEVVTRHRNRKGYDWCLRATRQDQLQIVSQVVQWSPECPDDVVEVTVIKESARRGSRAKPAVDIVEPRTVSFADALSKPRAARQGKRAQGITTWNARCLISG